jgi:oligopeptidase B
MFGIGVERSRSRGYIFLTSASHTTSEVRYLPADKPAEAFRLILPREVGTSTTQTTTATASTYARTRMARATSSSSRARRRTRPRELERGHPAPRGRDAERRRVVQRLLRRLERGNATPRPAHLRLQDEQGDGHPTPEPVYSIGLSTNREYDTAKVRYSYQSFVTPSSVYDYDVKTGKSELLKQQPVLGGYDPTLQLGARLRDRL